MNQAKQVEVELDGQKYKWNGRRWLTTNNLTPPKMITFGISVLLAFLGLLSFLGAFTLLPIEAFWLLFIAFALLAVSLMVKGL